MHEGKGNHGCKKVHLLEAKILNLKGRPRMKVITSGATAGGEKASSLDKEFLTSRATAGEVTTGGEKANS